MRHQLLPVLFIALAFDNSALRAEESEITVDKVTARNPVLSCSGKESSTDVDVQVSFPILAKSQSKQIVVSLAVYSYDPAKNKVLIVDGLREVTLEKSPTRVRFLIKCSDKSVPGEAMLAGAIVSGPTGVPIKQSVGTAFNPLKITIEK